MTDRGHKPAASCATQGHTAIDLPWSTGSPKQKYWAYELFASPAHLPLIDISALLEMEGNMHHPLSQAKQVMPSFS